MARERPNRRFHLTARFYDLAQDRNAYVRIRGMDPLQQEQMVLEYVRSYGSISRAQAASLCQVTPTEARRLLKGLTDRGGAHLGGRAEDVTLRAAVVNVAVALDR